MQLNAGPEEKLLNQGKLGPRFCFGIARRRRRHPVAVVVVGRRHQRERSRAHQRQVARKNFPSLADAGKGWVVVVAVGQLSTEKWQKEGGRRGRRSQARRN